MTELVAIVEKTAGRAHHGIHGKDIANVEQAAPSKNILSVQDEIHPRGAVWLLPDATKVCPVEAKAETGVEFALAGGRDAGCVLLPHG